MRRCTSIKSRHLWMLPAIVLCVGATSFGAIDFSNNTLTYSSTSDLSTAIDPPGQRDVTNNYGIDKASFLALSPQVVAFNGAPAATQTLRTLVVNYDASDAGNTVTFTFPADMYNYGSMTSVGRGAFSGSSLQDAISTVPVLNGSLYDWFDVTITSTGDKGVRALGFCVAFRSNQEVKAGQVLYTLSDATTATIDLPVLGNAGNVEYIFIGYQAPAGKTITRVQASRTDAAGGGYVSVDDLAFVMSILDADTIAPGAVSNLVAGSPSPTSLTLTWTAPGDDNYTGIATSYDIRYSTSDIDESNWASATQVTGEPAPAGAGTGQTMVVSGLSPFTTYYFAIKTSDEVPNTSVISNIHSGTTWPLDPTAPAAVSDLFAGTPTSSSLTLTWTAPGDDDSTGTATSYDIRYSTSAIDESNWASATQAFGEPTPAPAGTSQSMVVGSLSASTTYYFAIKTSDEIPNVSAISNSPPGTTDAPGSSSIIALKRDPGLLAGGGIDPRFAGAAVATTTVQDAVMYGSQMSRWYNGGRATVSEGADYTARLSHKYDLASVPAYAKINLAQLRLYSTRGSGSCGLAMVLTHDWIEGTKVSDYPGAAGGITYWAPIGYNTYYDQNPLGAGSQPWGGWGPNSDSGFDMAVDCGPIVNPSSSSQGYDVFDVTAHVQAWVRGGRPNFGWAQYDGKAICLSESASELQPVLFIDYALTGDTTPPATVADLTPSSVTTNSVTLSWTAPGDDGAAGTAAGYDIRYSTSPITAGSWVLATPVAGVPTPQAGGTTQSMVVSGLASDVTYYFAMKASDEVPNVSPLSNVAMAHPLADLIPPAAVSNLATSNLTNHSITLTWTAPGDDNDSGTAASYDIRYSTSEINASNWASATLATGEPAPAIAGTSQSLVIDNLTQDTTYYFAIKTSDERPNTSDLSNIAPGRTLADIIAPGAVTSLTITKAKSSALRLAWIASGDDGAEGTATSYDVRYRTGGPVTEANWASAIQVADEPVPVQSGYHRNMWITGLPAGTTYYVGIKAIDEVSNASTIATVSAATPAASLLTRPLLQPDDFEYLGAFKLPRFACGQSTSYSSAGIALRRVDGNLQFLAEAGYYDGSAIYECNFPGWGADASTWPQATIVHEWGTAVYGTPSVKPSGPIVTSGLSYDQATGRLYYSYASGYNVSQENVPSLGCAVLNESGPVASGPWLSPNVTVQAMRGGSLAIPDWFADTYLAGRKLGVGFGGGYSGWASCSPGPVLAAAHHPAGSATQLDTIRLLQYDQTDITHWATRDARYWSDGVYNLHNPVGDVGWWISMDGVGASAWIDLPDKQGLLYVTGRGVGRTWYDYGKECVERTESWWWVYDPADLAEVAQGHMNTWEPQHDSWEMSHRGPGCAFDAETRTLFLITPHGYTMGGQEGFPLVQGYRIKLAGDVNKDAHVDVEDLLWVVEAFGSVPGDVNYDVRCDFNTDDSVDVVDLLTLVENFGI